MRARNATALATSYAGAGTPELARFLMFANCANASTNAFWPIFAILPLVAAVHLAAQGSINEIHKIGDR